jgi:outer membrane lipoprotein-sorting protein
MKHFILLVLAIVIGSTTSLKSQTSKDILDKLSAKAKTFKTITADFTYTLNNPKTSTNQSLNGNVKVKGSKYYLSMSSYQIWCDGKTVWNYNKDNNEVTIDNLADVKDGGFDPSEMFTIWEKNFKHEMKNAAATVDGIGCYQIALYPNDTKSKAYHTVILNVDKSKMEVTKVEIKTRDNATMTYKVKNFKTTSEIGDGEFIFNKGKFPGVEEVDNRI